MSSEVVPNSKTQIKIQFKGTVSGGIATTADSSLKLRGSLYGRATQ